MREGGAEVLASDPVELPHRVNPVFAFRSWIEGAGRFAGLTVPLIKHAFPYLMTIKLKEAQAENADLASWRRILCVSFVRARGLSSCKTAYNSLEKRRSRYNFAAL